MTCPFQERGAIELFFYDELSPGERAEVLAHLRHCTACRGVLDDLSLISAALASRPDVSTPPGGDWSRFMARLDEAVHEGAMAGGGATRVRAGGRRGLSIAARALPYLAAAAVLALATLAGIMAGRQRVQPLETPHVARSGAASALEAGRRAVDPGLLSVSDQHFERSKLVVLGLATRDAAATPAASWEYERELATTLLGDTRLYRHAAEERGMSRLAGVMQDLELVLLQASMAEEPDRASLEQLQRLIRRRDLITRMNAGYAAEP